LYPGCNCDTENDANF